MVNQVCEISKQLCQNNQIMFIVGSVGQHYRLIYWLMYWLTLARYVSQVSAQYWWSVDRHMTDISADSRSSVSWVSVKCLLGIGQYVSLYVSQSSVSRVKADISTDTQQILDQHLTDTWPILNWHLTDCWLIYMYWPTKCRWIYHSTVSDDCTGSKQ